jgi:hypothetical protein
MVPGLAWFTLVSESMIFDDLSLRTCILLGVIVPPILTWICWLLSRRMARAQSQPVEPPGRAAFWGLLLAAYVLFAVALYSSRHFAGTERSDPAAHLVQ